MESLYFKRRTRWIWFCLCAGMVLHARGQEVHRLPDGIGFTAGGEEIEFRVASPHAFLVRMRGADFPAPPRRSIFLSDATQPPTPFKVFHGPDDSFGIETSFGMMSFDRRYNSWAFNGAGNVFRVEGSLPQMVDFKKAADHLGTSSVNLSEPKGWRMPPRFYGSGSLPNRGDLVQSGSDCQMSNGCVALPQYWCTEGYGALLLGAREDMPASWHFDGKTDVQWKVPGNEIELYLISAPNLADWLRGQAELTGFAPLPPRWALGYMQSRWGWKDKAYIDDTLAHFRKDRLPVDAFIFDFEWYAKYNDYGLPAEGKADFVDFGWNDTLFPEPAQQIADFAKDGIRVVGIRKPRLGNTQNLALARSKGWITPLSSQYSLAQRNLDFSKPEMRAWYEEKMRKFCQAGMAGFWNDEGELLYDEYAYWNLAEWETFQQVKPDGRFWSINRAFTPGLQRFGAATWSGDIDTDWKTLARTPGDLLAYSLSGMPYAGCDIGGFQGTPSPELLVRWMEAAVFFPVMRSHSMISQTPRFPWLYGTEAENAIRKALELRYRLIPYYNSLAYLNHQTAMPLMRPLVMEFPNDAKVFNETDEWLMGPGLLAAPVLAQGGQRSVYLPAGRWYRYSTNEVLEGPQTINVTAKLNEIPVYVRAGTLLPLGPVVQSTSEMNGGELGLEIYAGKDGSFDLVEDDGTTRAYERGVVKVTHFIWDDRARRLTWKSTGSYDGVNCFQGIRAVLFEAGRVRVMTDKLGSGSILFSAN